MYTYLHMIIHIHMHKHISIDIPVKVHMHKYMYCLCRCYMSRLILICKTSMNTNDVTIHLQTHKHAHIHTYTHTHTHTHTHRRTHTYLDTHSHTQIYIFTMTHTHTMTCTIVQALYSARPSSSDKSVRKSSAHTITRTLIYTCLNRTTCEQLANDVSFGCKSRVLRLQHTATHCRLPDWIIMCRSARSITRKEPQLFSCKRSFVERHIVLLLEYTQIFCRNSTSRVVRLAPIHILGSLWR